MKPARYVALDEARGRPHVMLDSLPVAGTIFTLSHWPSVVNPIAVESETSTGIVLDFLRAGGRPAEVGACTAAHFDVDGLLSLYVAVRGTASLDDSFVRALACAGDFDRAASERVRRAAFALEEATHALVPGLSHATPAGRVAQLYERMLAWLDERLDRLHAGAPASGAMPARERWHERTAALLAATPTALHSVARGLVDAIELDAVAFAGAGLEHADGAYLGLEPFAVHARCEALAVLVSHAGRHRLVQRYESWVQAGPRDWSCRRDLAPLCAALRELDPHANWRYRGVQHPFARLETAAGRVSALTPLRLRELVERFHATTPAGWHPHLLD